jgi:hypothetical protein
MEVEEEEGKVELVLQSPWSLAIVSSCKIF